MKRIRKHRRDQKNGKNGWVAGNVRYSRNSRKETRGNRTMGKASGSRC